MISLPIYPFVRERLPAGFTRSVVALLVLALLVLASPGSAAAQEPATPTPPADTAAAVRLSPEQLESLVAPIALYPDALLAQTLVASTYPLEVVQLHQWLAKHPDLKDKALADSVAKQPWDPSVQSMAAVPEVVKRLAEDIQWTTELGNAFLAQQSDVMDAVQVMRQKALDQGALESTEHQMVETQTVENTTVIVIEPTDPEVIYVPTYNPTVVYPPPVYPYPPIYYPPYYPGQAFVTFSIGFAMGAAFWGGPCCYAGWGGNNIYINRDNNFNNVNIDRGDRTEINAGDRNRGQGGRGDTWQHNPSHRGGAPYGDKATSDRFGGSRGESGAGTMDARGQRSGASAGVGDRAAGGAGGPTGGAGVSDRAGGARGAAGAGVSDRSAGGRSGSRESIGNRSVPSGSGSGAWSGGSRGYSGSSARASSARGRSSFGGSRGGGRRR
jgi:hypothetical protein